MKGVDGLVGRTKGGASKEKIKTDPAFVRTRELNAEFGGRATAGGWIARNTWPMKQLADHNVAGPLNALLRPIQKMDTQSVKGQHNIVLSQHPQLLNGFSFNRKNTFDSTVRNPLSFSLDRATLTAQVDIPALLPGINLAANPNYPMYSIVAALGIVPDLFFGALGYRPSEGYHTGMAAMSVYTDWYPVMQGSAATTLALKYPLVMPDDKFSVVLSIGICYGIMLNATTIQQAKHAGAAKILATA
jgi:hypothetical protein